jgi:predicted nucleic acid binding AN1-type Zn finger protein
MFCNSHRLPETHTCSYNFKKAGQVELEKTVIKVSNGKIAHI